MTELPKGAVASDEEMAKILEKAKEAPLTLFVVNHWNDILKLHLDERSYRTSTSAIISNVPETYVFALSKKIHNPGHDWYVFENYWDAYAHSLNRKK